MNDGVGGLEDGTCSFAVSIRRNSSLKSHKTAERTLVACENQMEVVFDMIGGSFQYEQ